MGGNLDGKHLTRSMTEIHPCVYINDTRGIKNIIIYIASILFLFLSLPHV